MKRSGLVAAFAWCLLAQGAQGAWTAWGSRGEKSDAVRSTAGMLALVVALVAGPVQARPPSAIEAAVVGDLLDAAEGFYAQCLPAFKRYSGYVADLRRKVEREWVEGIAFLQDGTRVEPYPEGWTGEQIQEAGDAAEDCSIRELELVEQVHKVFAGEEPEFRLTGALGRRMREMVRTELEYKRVMQTMRRDWRAIEAGPQDPEPETERPAAPADDDRR